MIDAINVTITQYWLNTSKGEGMNEIDILRWVHILAMVYWLGGEWEFSILTPINNHKLSWMNAAVIWKQHIVLIS